MIVLSVLYFNDMLLIGKVRAMALELHSAKIEITGFIPAYNQSDLTMQ